MSSDHDISDKDIADGIEWVGYCYDDGSGQNICYVNSDGSKSRKKPLGIKYELFKSGDRKFYNRGICIGCKKSLPATLIVHEDGKKAVEYTTCNACILLATPGISEIRNNGDLIYKNNKETPKSLMLDLDEMSLRESRESEISQRALFAKCWVQQQSNSRRNHDRRHVIAEKAAKYDIFGGTHVSWGADSITFDEYYGAVNSDNQPHGLGIKFYSDSSVYCGGWRDGVQHNSDSNVGYWISSIETEYTGTWLYGVKHGRGTQSYPDGSLYIGEFMKGFEHGFGRKRLPDGNFYEGRYNAGRRDGHGIFLTVNGSVIERGIFRDDVRFEDVYPPAIHDVSEVERNKGQRKGSVRGSRGDIYHEPQSLMQICFKEIGRHLQPVVPINGRQSMRVTSHDVTRIVPSHFKQRLVTHYLAAMQLKGTNQFSEYLMMSDIAYNYPTHVRCSSVLMSPPDMSALCSLQGSNQRLYSLSLTWNKLSSTSLLVLFDHMRMCPCPWPNLLQVDLSMNTLDAASVVIVMDGLTDAPTIRSLRLSGCGVKSDGAIVISEFLASNTTLQELDLSFNLLKAEGASLLTQGLITNHSLTSLSLRQNNIGHIGGIAFVSLYKVNATLLDLCLADNDIGVEAAAQITGRSRSTVRSLFKSTCAGEVRIPRKYLVQLEKAKKSVTLSSYNYPPCVG